MATADHRQRIAHPADLQRRPGQPRLSCGLIASSNTLLKDAVMRGALRDQRMVAVQEQVSQ